MSTPLRVWVLEAKGADGWRKLACAENQAGLIDNFLATEEGTCKVTEHVALPVADYEAMQNLIGKLKNLVNAHGNNCDQVCETCELAYQVPIGHVGSDACPYCRCTELEDRLEVMQAELRAGKWCINKMRREALSDIALDALDEYDAATKGGG